MSRKKWTPEKRILRRFVATFISTFAAQFLIQVETGRVFEDLNQTLVVSLIAAILMGADKALREIRGGV